jgi:ATP/maltotriose-dependent transcriptional regulator MalT
MTFEQLIVTTDKAIYADKILSGREIEVLQLAAEGLSNKQIGQNLNISEDTIDTHNRSIVAKLGARNMKQAIAIGIRGRIIK